MPPFLSTSKAFGSYVSRKNGAVRHLIRTVKNEGIDRNRCVGSVASVDKPWLRKTVGAYQDCRSNNLPLGSVDCSNYVQSRRFLGCGDGEEGGALSKVYEERHVLGYSPEQLFDVVAAVDLYHGFVPWCQQSEILRHYPDGSFDAELVVGFKFLVESYISHVELDRPKSIKTTAKDTGLFDHLINNWEFNPGPIPGTCDVYFLVDFKFQSPIYRQVASMFFKEVVARMVGSFTDRCRLIYGPAVPVVNRSYEQRA